MAGNSHLAHTPLRAISDNLYSAATGLRSKDGVALGVLDLTPDIAWRNFIDILCRASPRLGRAVLTIGPFAVLAYGLYHHVWQGFRLHTLLDKFTAHFHGRITIPGDHALHGSLLSWMAKNGVETDTRSLTVHSISNQRVHARGSNSIYEEPVQRQELSYVPSVGSNVFYWNGYKLRILREADQTEQLVDSTGQAMRGHTKVRESDITISTYSLFGGDIEIIKAFLDHVDKTAEPADEVFTRIHRISKYMRDGELWDRPISRAPRGLESVTMEAEKKQNIVQDLQDYLHPSAKIWYANRGIPWRRGYLLYGPPGTGKTSFTVAIAGHFSLDVFIVSMTMLDLTDDRLEQLFDLLPTRCVVLLEDIDSAGIQRESMKPSTSGQSGKKSKSPKRTRVSLAGLLNVIDGPCSAEGRVLFLTSNSPDSLDPALVRSGRIDRKILFGHASSEVTEKMFLHIFSSAPGEKPSHIAEQYDLPALAKEFAAKMPEDKLTPAEIQNFLLENRDDVLGAVEKVGKWAEELVHTKARGKNVAAFSGQVGAGAEKAATTDDGVLVNGNDHAEDVASGSDDETEEETQRRRELEWESYSRPVDSYRPRPRGGYRGSLPSELQDLVLASARETLQALQRIGLYDEQQHGVNRWSPKWELSVKEAGRNRLSGQLVGIQ
ncbi:mitochondrial chaperone bcs1 [Lecanosticta acicola]|uniref:Mitochondrial chaperone bcs1 n=1 Tax=Lecanosticta acicola TaxID=111012 RepID=A0AAI9EA93_9PEZI|nr:mitochondrial chaperone bcs1 [Lecanosticta acicola]